MVIRPILRYYRYNNVVLFEYFSDIIYNRYRPKIVDFIDIGALKHRTDTCILPKDNPFQESYCIECVSFEKTNMHNL